MIKASIFLVLSNCLLANPKISEIKPLPKATVLPENKAALQAVKKINPTPTPNPTEIPLSVTELKSIQKAIKASSLSVDFSISMYRSLRKKTSEKKGKGIFLQPNNFRWTVFNEIAGKDKTTEWIFNGSLLTFYERDTRKKTQYPKDQAQSKELLQVVDIVLNLESLFDSFTLDRSFSKDDFVYLFLTAKNNYQMERLEIKINKKLNFVNELTMFFKGDNRSTYLFTNPVFNKASLVDLKI